MSRNPVARNAWRANRPAIIADKRAGLRRQAALDDDLDYPCVRCSALVHWQGALCARCLEDEPE